MSKKPHKKSQPLPPRRSVMGVQLPSLKVLVWVGSACAALASMGTAYAMLKPWLDSGPPPLASVGAVNELKDQFAQFNQQEQQRWQQQQNVQGYILKEAVLADWRYWDAQRQVALQMMRQHPGDPGPAAMYNGAMAQLRMLAPQLGMPSP